MQTHTLSIRRMKYMQHHPISHISNMYTGICLSRSHSCSFPYFQCQSKHSAVVGNEAKVQKKFWQPKLSELNENACNATFARVSHTSTELLLSIWIFLVCLSACLKHFATQISNLTTKQQKNNSIGISLFEKDIATKFAITLICLKTAENFLSYSFNVLNDFTQSTSCHALPAE